MTREQKGRGIRDLAIHIPETTHSPWRIFRQQKMKSKKVHHPPSHLSEPSQAFWRDVQAAYVIEDRAGLELLRLAAEALDTSEKARLAIEEHGQTYVDRFGAPRPRPEVAIQRNAMQIFTRLVRTLGVDLGETK